MGEWASGPRKQGTRLPPKFKKNKSIVYMFLNKGVVFVSNHVQESFSKFQIRSSACVCASPTSAISNVDDELIVKILTQTAF